MTRLVVLAALTALSCVAPAADVEQSQLVGNWSGRIERPGVESGRRMAQLGTAEFGADHKFVCHFANPEQEPRTEQGTWNLQKGRLFITTGETNGTKVNTEARLVEFSPQPLEMRLPVNAGAWVLVLRPVETSE